MQLMPSPQLLLITSNQDQSFASLLQLRVLLSTHQDRWKGSLSKGEKYCEYLGRHFNKVIRRQIQIQIHTKCHLLPQATVVIISIGQATAAAMLGGSKRLAARP